MTLVTGLAVVACVLLGSASQRITGMGFALVVSPFLVVLLGAADGVLAVNALGAFSAAFVIPQVWRKMDKPVIIPLTLGALVGVIVGVSVVRVLTPAVLSISVAILMVLVLLVVGLLRRPATQTVRLEGLMFVGLLSGTLTSAAAVGGPPLVYLGRVRRWSAERFAATIQPVAIIVAVASIVGKLLTGGAKVPDAPWWIWAATACAVPLGVWIGGVIAPRVRGPVLWTTVYAIACAGAAVAMGKAISAILTA